MTKAEHLTLSDSINVAQLTMERTGHLLQTMLDDYFGKFDPDDAGDAFYLRFYFPRMRAFAFLLREQLNGISEALPSVEWVDGLKCEEVPRND